MPFYSDPGYYYGGGGGGYLYSPYYSSSSPYSTSPYTSSPYTSSPYSSYSSGYGRPLGGSYIPSSSRVSYTSTSRYKPKLSTISETSGLIPLTRIQSPKVSYHTSPHFTPPRPISINTADIDVSEKRYRKRSDRSDRSEENDDKSKSADKVEQLKSVEESSDCNNNNVQEQQQQQQQQQDSPFMPRVDGSDPVMIHYSIIRRDRPLVRLSINRKPTGSQKKRGSKKDSSAKKQKRSKELKEASKEDAPLSWRDRFKEDYTTRRRESPRKSPGELLREKHLIRHKNEVDKESEAKVIEEIEKVSDIPIEQLQYRRMSLPKPPSFHDICADISSDKLDDDLNAGELRRRASIIHEQEAEIINQLQKSASGTLHLLLERDASEHDLRKSTTKRKSKKVKKVRHKITATVNIDPPPAQLTAIVQERPEENDVEMATVTVPREPKLKATIEKIEEDHTIHKIFKLPKKRPKKIVEEQEIKEENLPEEEDGFFNKTAPEDKVQTNSKPKNTSSTKNKIAVDRQSNEEDAIESPKALKKESKTPIQSPTATQSPKGLQYSKVNSETKKPEFFTFDIDATKSFSSSEIQTPVIAPGTPKTPSTPKTPITPKTPKITIPLKKDSEIQQSVAKPKPITKMQKSDSGEDFWAQIGSRETLYMSNRKKLLLERQWAKRESLLESEEASETNEVDKLNEIKQKIGSQKAEAMKKAEEIRSDSIKHSESNESVLMQKHIEDSKSKKEVKDKKLVAQKVNEKSSTPTFGLKTSTNEIQSGENQLRLSDVKDEKSTTLTGVKALKVTEALPKLPQQLTANSENVRNLQQQQQSKPKINDGGLKAKSPEIGGEQENSSVVAIKNEPPQVPLSEENARATTAVTAVAKKASSSPKNKPRKTKSQDEKEESVSTVAGRKTQPPASLKGDVNSSASEESGRKGVTHVEEQQKSKSLSNGTDHHHHHQQQQQQQHQEQQKQNDKIKAKEIGSRKEDKKKLTGLEKPAKRLSEQQQETKTNAGTASSETAIVKSPQSPPPTPLSPKSDVTSLNDKTQIKAPSSATSTAAEKLQTSLDSVDKNEKIVGGDISDVNKTKDELGILGSNRNNEKNEECTTTISKLSKFPTVSDLNRCLQDVDAELADYIPSGPENTSSYDSSDEESDSMRKKNRDKKKEEKFDPNKVIKLDHTKKCYVKNEAPPYPLVATPRPLWKREKFNYSKESESESDETDSESECSSSNESSDELNPNKDNIIRMSTCSNDSGFEGGTAPSSPKKMLDCDVNCHKKCEKLTANLCGVNQKLIVEALSSVRRGAHDARDSPCTPPSLNPAYKIDHNHDSDDLETSYTFAQFQKSGRITAPATIIPRFKKYSVEDFHFLAVLGKGSFGKVLLAELRNTEYYYAVKCLKKDVVLEDDDVECTLIERKVLALGTKHPYLCHLFCTFQTDSHLFFVMEYLNGGDLMFHIQQSGRFPEARARFYGAEIISGLKFLHKKGIIYRDLKLDNVLLDFDGHVRIADFGMCKLQIYLDKTADSFCGTPDYMAPEIIKGENYNQNVDWWSFGVLLYEMLIGQSPFSGCDEDELFWSICNEIPWFPIFISQEATNILKGLLEKDSNVRIGSHYSPAGDICSHRFFDEIDWQRLERREMEPPFKPQVKHPLDTQYFDKAFTRERVRLTPIDKEILQSMDQEQFQGFSYTNPNATLN